MSDFVYYRDDNDGPATCLRVDYSRPSFPTQTPGVVYEARVSGLGTPGSVISGAVGAGYLAANCRRVPRHRVPADWLCALDGVLRDMSQPVFKCIANLGDVGWLDHGGVFVYEDLTGVYPPELEVVDVPDYPDRTLPAAVVYRVCCDKCYFTDGVLSDNKHHKDHPVWWERVLAGDAEDVNELIRLVCSDDPLERAMGYERVSSSYGWYEFDSDPLRFDDRRQLERRYALGNREPYLYAGSGIKPRLRPKPAVLAWNDGCVVKLAEAAERSLRQQHDAATLPILADALEDAGCTMTPVLDHLRAGGRHFEDCWAVKWCLNKPFPRKERD